MQTSANVPGAIHLNAAAAERVRAVLLKPQNAGENLRLDVEQGGRGGRQCAWTLDAQPVGGLKVEPQGIPVVEDSFCLEYLRGASGGLKITKSDARESCGCGKSFTA